MPQTYAFQVALPVNDTLPRNRCVNKIHLQHTIGSLLDTDLESMCADIVEMYQTHYGDTIHEVDCRAYDTDAVPNYPRAQVTVNVGNAWTCGHPREIALCLSYAAHNRGNKSERGRMYLMPQLASPLQTMGLRPDSVSLNWALAWYTQPNSSLPDLGGVDWQFGVWSPTYKRFTKTEQAWVNDDWDVQRRRGLRETTRVEAVREG
jgi:hypothetical protein